MRATVEPLENRLLLAVTPLYIDGESMTRRAASLGRVWGEVVVVDALQSGEVNDFYSFEVRGKGNVNITLDGLTSNANLRLINSNGEVIGSSANIRARSELVSKTLGKGTYYIGVDRGKRGADTPFSMSVQADMNYEHVEINGDNVTLSLTNSDGSAARIDPTRETWVTIHGWLGEPSHMRDISKAIDAASKYVQVLELDWSDVASDANPFNVVFSIDDVGSWAADKLESWGLPGSKINLIGHSYGGYMTDEIARDISGGVDRIVALDPATTSFGGTDLSGTNYAAHSQFSVAFIGSSQGTEAAVQTADETVLMGVGSFGSFTAHGNVRDLFAKMTARNNSNNPGTISPMFALSKLHLGQRPPFKNNGVSNQYDAYLVGSGNGFSIVPTTLAYTNVNNGAGVVIND